MPNPPETPPHSSSDMLSRRQFLQGVAGIFCVTFLPEPLFGPALADSPAYFCKLDLTNGQLSGCGGRCPSGQPGSLMKLVTASALLESHRLDPDETFTCQGILQRHGLRFRCQHAHGKLGLNEALGHSCNLYFVQAGDRLSSAQWVAFARRWGLDRPMAKASPHRFPDSKHLLAHSQLYGLGLSAELQPDAWQLLRMAVMIARQGRSMPGAFAMEDPGFSLTTWEMLQSGMRRAVRSGTAIGLDADNTWHAAAKTGTTPHGKSYQSWVMGYFPYEEPTAAFCLRAFQGTGKDTAVPMARRYLKKSSL